MEELGYALVQRSVKSGTRWLRRISHVKELASAASSEEWNQMVEENSTIG